MIKWKNGIEGKLFSSEDLEKISKASKEILMTTGVVFQSPEALAIFQDHGATVDWPAHHVYFTEKMIDDALKAVPSQFTLKGRNPRFDYEMTEENSGFTTFGVGFSVIDRKSGELRASTKKDLIETAIISDYLDALDIYSHAITARDCPLSSIDLHEAEAFLTNTEKHCMHLNLGRKQNIRKFITMAGLFVGGENNLYDHPLVSALTCPLSPLRFGVNNCDVIIEFARVGLPVNILPMAIACQTAPASLCGTLVVSNAEFIAGLTLAQLVSPGTPVIYGCSNTCFNFANNMALVGTPQLGLCSASAAAMARHYQIPSYVAGT